MLPKEEQMKFPVICPHCRIEVQVGDFGWLDIFDDLSQFGKTVLDCPHCKRLFMIREEDEDGPFVCR